MPRVLLPLVALCALASANAQKIGEVPKHAPDASPPKGEVLEWQSSAGQPYWYRLPKTSRGKPALILMLHGTGGNHGWSFWNYSIAQGKFRSDDIVVSPDGVTPGQGGTFNFVQGKKDGDQIVEIIKTFRKSFDIGKVYVYGHSQGAFFCYWFAGAHPELIDGIVAHAGNVLNVAHPKLAKEKVGIGILHGKADAVVSVECAHRTHDIYKEQGYQKLKLEIVEGLTAQSGHWPLPKQVGEMLDWLDSVTADTAPAALGAALSELGKDAPDLSTVASAYQKARALLKKHDGDDVATLQERIAAVEQLLNTTMLKHGGAIEAAECDDKVKDPAPWIEHYRIASQAFGMFDDWDDRFAKLARRASSDEKRVQKALTDIGAKKWNKSALKKAVATLEKGLLAPSHKNLRSALEQKLGEATKGIDADDVAAVKAQIEAMDAAAKTGAEACAKLTAELAKEFREAHPDWF